MGQETSSSRKEESGRVADVGKVHKLPLEYSPAPERCTSEDARKREKTVRNGRVSLKNHGG